MVRKKGFFCPHGTTITVHSLGNGKPLYYSLSECQEKNRTFDMIWVGFFRVHRINFTKIPFQNFGPNSVMVIWFS